MTALRTESRTESMGKVARNFRWRVAAPGGGWRSRYAASGRDGSPSRPFADKVATLVRLNGGLGEPALPKASRSKRNRMMSWGLR